MIPIGNRILFIPPNPIERWLNKIIYKSKFVYLDRWSIVHFGTGVLLGYLLITFRSILTKILPFTENLKSGWIVFWLLVAYEIFEVLFWGKLFKKESFLNISWDIILGMIGFGCIGIL